MELNEATRRIFGQHWELIICCMLLGICAAAAMHLGDQPKYTASTRLVLGTDDPKTSSESAGISDTAWALGTAPSNVRAALDKAGIKGRDPLDVAKEVSVKAVGASGVLELSVSDRSPRVATRLADAIADKVRQTRLEANDAAQRRALGDIDEQVTLLNRKIAEMDSKTAASVGTQTQSEALKQQRAVLETQRTSALIDASQQPRPLIVSPAGVPLHADPSGRWPDIVLGAILGLVLGAGLAALLETLRPTLVGGEVLARELGTPLLGSLSGRPTAQTDGEAPAVAGRLRLASKAAGVQNIGLLPLRKDVDLPRLAEELVQHDDGSGEGASGRERRIRPFDVRSSELVNGAGTGLVVVAPAAPKKAELEALRHLLSVTPGPLLGVVTYTGRAVKGNPLERHLNGNGTNGHANGHADDSGPTA